MVDVSGAYDARTALKLIQQVQHLDVGWLEEPVSSDNLDALHWLRDRAPAGMAIAAGKYGWCGLYFRRMLQAQAVDVLMADATRCGLTGYMHATHFRADLLLPYFVHTSLSYP